MSWQPPGGAGRALIPGLAGYADLQLIAHGSTAMVFRATQTRLNRTVAIKVLLVDDVMTTEANVARELETTVALSSQPHIVSIIDTGVTDDGSPYIVMEYCEGGSYAQILKRRGPLPVAEALEVGVKIGEALHAAHEVGIVHRDVKPPNILRSRFGPALADFGIARAADDGGIATSTLDKLTPHHASPEALRRDAQSGLSDLYSLASTLWNLLIGRPPFADPTQSRQDPMAFRERVLSQPVPPVPRDDVPQWLQDELARAMAKSPADRHPSAGAFADALRQQGARPTAGSPWSPAFAGPPAPPVAPPTAPDVTSAATEIVPGAAPAAATSAIDELATNTRAVSTPASAPADPAADASTPAGPPADARTPAGPAAHASTPADPPADGSAPASPWPPLATDAGDSATVLASPAHADRPGSPPPFGDVRPLQTDAPAPPPTFETPTVGTAATERPTPAERASWPASTPAASTPAADQSAAWSTRAAPPSPTEPAATPLPAWPTAAPIPTEPAGDAPPAWAAASASWAAKKPPARAEWAADEPATWPTRADAWPAATPSTPTEPWPETAAARSTAAPARPVVAPENAPVATDGAPDRRSLLRPVLATSLVGVVFGVLIVLATAVLGDRPPSTALRPNPGPTRTATVTHKGAPRDVQLEDHGSSVTVTWANADGSRAPNFVMGAVTGQQARALARTDAGSSTATVNGLNARLDYCFAVVAFYSATDAAESERVCTHRLGGAPPAPPSAGGTRAPAPTRSPTRGPAA